MSIIQGSAKQRSVRSFYPKVINGSLRFNDDDSAYLSWTPTGTSGGRTTFTYSGWVKVSKFSTSDGFYLLTAPHASNQNGSLLYIGGDNRIAGQFRTYSTGTQGAVDATFTSSMLVRDPSAWYHIVFAYDSTAAETSRMKLWVNGVSQSFNSVDWPSASNLQYIGSNNDHLIGRWLGSSHANTNGYMANVHFIDGQALTASDFGETKNGVWVAKDYAGTFGTNGFYLTFEDDTQVEAFNTVLYRGSGSKQSITGVGFQPDLVWVKRRDSATNHNLFDAVRGAGTRLFSDITNAEEAGSLISFDADGFTDDGARGDTGASGGSYVAWCWKAGDSNVSNTDGTITSTVRANPTYGFSIVSYTSNATTLNGDNFGHGLGVAPDFVIIKNRTIANDWAVYHSSIGNTKALFLNQTSTGETSVEFWNNTSPDSSVITLGRYGYVNRANDDFIAYCWSETTGYSKFGSYTGGTNPQTITTGFPVGFVLIKNSTSATNNWIIYDRTRDVTTVAENSLCPDSSAAENGISLPNDNIVEFTSDGFKLTTTNALTNASGDTYIYAAFADTREAAFWLDQSGNDNDWQPVNLDHNDTLLDSPTNNFATLNPLDKTGGSFSEGNLAWEATGSNSMVRSTIAMTSGKWYAEIKAHTAPYFQGFGVHKANAPLASGSRGGLNADSWVYEANGAASHNNVQTALGAFSANDIVMIAVDIDAGKLWWGVNGTWKNGGDPSAGTNAIYTNLGGEPMQFVSGDYYFEKATWNFGQQPFKYDPPA